MNISSINSNLIQSNYKINNVQKAQNVSFSGYIKTTSPVYMIDIKGSVIKFSNINEAQEKLGVDKKELYDKVKNGEYFDNFAIVYAEDIEKNVPDLEKIKEAAKNIKETSFYLVDMFGDYRKYGSLKEAACDLNIQPDNISAALNKRRQTVGGLVAYRPSEMETLNENGKVGLVIGIPLRYCHGSYSMVHEKDLKAALDLVCLLAEKIGNEQYSYFIDYEKE